MKRKKKFVSLFVALAMMCAAAITVNGSLFGHTVQHKAKPEGIESDTCSNVCLTMPDGMVKINTAHLAGTSAGYAGEVPLEVYVKDGLIVDIKPLPNSETPGFFNRASALLNAWIGKTVDEAAAMHVDAVSGATYTSNAIISNVNAALAAYDGAGKSNRANIPWKIWVAFAVTLAACIVPLFVRNRLYHSCQLVANVVVLGFWCSQFLDYSLMLRYLSSGIPLEVLPVAAAMLAAAFIYPLFGRPQHYCNHICPLGSAQLLVGQLCGFKVKIRPKVITALNWFRKILWFALMVLLWADTLTEWMDLELFQAFQLKSAPEGIIIAAVAFLLLSAVVNRPYCRFLCPTGSLFKQAEDFR